MTFIQLNKTQNKINFLILILTLAAIFSAVWGVFLYNQLVNFRHEIVNYEKIVGQAEVENAELKNALYQMMDAENPESAIDGRLLIIENKPQYVRIAESLAEKH